MDGINELLQNLFDGIVFEWDERTHFWMNKQVFINILHVPSLSMDVNNFIIPMKIVFSFVVSKSNSYAMRGSIFIVLPRFPKKGPIQNFSFNAKPINETNTNPTRGLCIVSIALVSFFNSKKVPRYSNFLTFIIDIAFCQLMRNLLNQS